MIERLPSRLVAAGAYEQTASTGTGEAFNEIVAAFQGKLTAAGFDRMVTHVGIFGHSYGGGATYDLAWRTNIAYPAIKIDYTAYVDAISRVGIRQPERRLPLPDLDSRFHDNFYQRNVTASLGFAGDTTLPGPNGTAIINNVIVNTQRDWRQENGNEHVHTSIDNEQKLWEEIVTHMNTRMTR